MAKKMMTIRELSETVGLSEYAIRLGIRQHQYPALKVGRKYLIDYNLFMETLKERQLANILTVDNDSGNAIGYDKLREI